MGGLIMASTINADTSDGLKLTSDTSGEIELQSAGVTKAKVTANGLQDANGNSLRGGSYRNLLINGDMQIAQRGTSATGITSSNYYTVDRWRTVNDTTGTWTQSQDTDVPTGQGFSNSLKMDCTVADASLSANDGLQIHTRLEGQNLQHLKKGTSNAESITVSFWVKSNKTGTYIYELYDQDNARQVSKSYTIDTADTWEKKTITIDGDTTGAFDNDNANSLSSTFWLSAGSNKTSGTLNTSWAASVTANRVVGQVNLADSTSNYINITGVQLEVGEGATEFEHRPYDAELARCLRYYWTAANGDSKLFGNGQYWSSSEFRIAFQPPVPMRTIPSLDHTTGTNYYRLSRVGDSDYCDSFTFLTGTASENFFGINNASQASGTAGDAGWWLTANASAYIAFSAEL
jgi:hypothetical protein